MIARIVSRQRQRGRIRPDELRLSRRDLQRTESRQIHRSQSEIVGADAGKTGFMTTRVLKGEEVERLVFLQRTVQRETALHARVGRILHGGERIHRLNLAVAQITERGSMDPVCARSRDDVDHSAGGSAVLGSVAVGNDLELLHRLLGNGRAHAVH